MTKRQKLDHSDHQPQESGAVPPSIETGDELSEADIVEREMALPIEHVKSYKHELDYRNKLVLAPMVRTGSCKS
jgi:hypothetical protein